MNMIIMTSGVRWNEPVNLRIGYGMPERIRSPKDALNHLLFRWPTVRGEKYSTARNICSAAEGNSLLHNEARMAFVEACVEADVLD